MIRRLRAMWLFAQHFPLCPEQCPQWERDDAVALNHFLNSATGRKLVLTIRYQEQASNATAVLKHDRHEYASGWAAGFRGALAWFQSLSETRTPQPTQPEEPSEPDGDLEHLRP